MGIKITDYADRLLQDLDTLDWPSATIEMQKIGLVKVKASSSFLKLIKVIKPLRSLPQESILYLEPLIVY